MVVDDAPVRVHVSLEADDEEEEVQVPARGFGAPYRRPPTPPKLKIPQWRSLLQQVKDAPASSPIDAWRADQPGDN